MTSTGSKRRLEHYRWVVFSLLAAAYLLVYFHRLSPAVVAVDMMKDLNAGGALMGLLGSAYFYPYALMQLPAGLLSDSWGPRRTVAVSFLLAGVASIFFGLAATANWAIFARVLVGLGVSMLFVPTMKILTQWFKRTEFAMMTAVLMAVGGLGVLTAASPLAYMSSLLGWRGSFIIIGLVTIVLAVAVWFLVRNRPQDLGFPPIEEPLSATPGTGAAVTIPLGQGMKMVLKRRSFWPLAAWFFFDLGIFFSFGGLWGGPYLMHVYGLTKAQAGNVLSMMAVAMIFGCPVIGYLSDQVFKSRKKILIGCSVLVLILTIPLAFFPDGMNVPLLYVFCFLLSLGSSSVVIIGFTSAKELFPVSIAGTSVGLINFFPFIGGAVMQPLLGWVLESQVVMGQPYTAAAYGRTFTLLFISAIMMLIASCLLEDTWPDSYKEKA